MEAERDAEFCAQLEQARLEAAEQRESALLEARAVWVAEAAAARATEVTALRAEAEQGRAAAAVQREAAVREARAVWETEAAEARATEVARVLADAEQTRKAAVKAASAEAEQVRTAELAKLRAEATGRLSQQLADVSEGAAQQPEAGEQQKTPVHEAEPAGEVELAETGAADRERAGATAAELELRANDASVPPVGEDVDYVRYILRQAELARADEEDHGLVTHGNHGRPETAESAAVAAETKNPRDSRENLERLFPRREGRVLF